MTASLDIELLAPVGTMEALRAAVQNGADAVYLGGKQFNARQNAANFDTDELKEVVRYAHLHGVRVYVAVNTLVANGEFDELLAYLHTLYCLNVDAIIVQDLGVAAAIINLLPGMEIHASTQMAIHNGAGARFLEKMGFSRAILAREVSLHNIKLIGNVSTIPLEVFVHGALCVSYSGQCLMSSMIGGRSGNRGRCAQPCRLPYTLVNEAGEEIMSGHLLSPRDLNMIEHLPLLSEAKVVSLKVEGRMKRPEYVATVIRHYRHALDGSVLPEAPQELTQIFNRDFTTGYFLEKPGQHLMSYQRPNNRGLYIGRVTGYHPGTGEVTVRLEERLKTGDGYQIWVTKGGRIAGEIRSLKQDGKVVEKAQSGDVVFSVRQGKPQPGDRVFKTLDTELMERAGKTFLSPRGTCRFPLDMILYVQMGEPVRLAARDEQDNRVEVRGEYLAVRAEKHPLTRDAAFKQLGRLGNTVFYLRELTLDTAEGVMAPASELNNLRRQAVEKLEVLRLKRFEKQPLSMTEYRERIRVWRSGLPEKNKVSTSPVKAPLLSINVGDMASLQAALGAGADIIYFGGESFRRKEGIRPDFFARVVRMCHDRGVQAVLQLPRIYHEEKAGQVRNYCQKGGEAGADGYLAGNPGILLLAQELGLTGLRADYTLNIFNDYTIRLLLDWGVEQVTLSPELTLEQIKNFSYCSPAVLECIVHGRFPLMVTEHCAVGNILGKGHAERGCPGPCMSDRYGLKDRMNMVFPLECDENCRMHIFNPKTLCMAERLPELIDSGVSVLRIEAEREEASWVKKIVRIYHREIERYLQEGPGYRMKEESKEILKELSPEGFTTGHYYRGV